MSRQDFVVCEHVEWCDGCGPLGRDRAGVAFYGARQAFTPVICCVCLVHALAAWGAAVCVPPEPPEPEKP